MDGARAVFYNLECRASETWAYGNCLVHPDFCLTRRDVVFFRETTQLAWEDRRRADKVELTFRKGESYQTRLGSVVPRTRVVAADGIDGDRREATHALLMILGGVRRDPLQYALHSGRIGGATQLAAQPATNVQTQRAGRWKPLAFVVYVRAGGKGAEFVSQVLT